MSAGEQAPLPFYEKGLPHLDRFQRIEVLSSNPEGFLPTSKPEQVEAMGLQALIDKSWGTSKHLAEVRRGQNKARTSDPERASRKITRNYVDWALDARETSINLSQLEADIKDINPELSLSEPDLSHDIAVGGLLKFLRFFDLSTLRDKGRIQDVGYDPQSVNYSPDNPGIMAHLEMAKDSWRLGQVKRKLELAQQDSGNRFVFWMNRLVEVKKHSPKNLAAIASEGIDKVYGRDRVK